MLFTKTKLKGAYVIEIERKKDERGFFARTYCQREYEAQGIDFNIVQANVSYNKKKATLRGLHAQLAPYKESKLVRCSCGSIYDVIVDMRKNSSTYLQWHGEELTADNSKMMYIPEGFAHGFITLEDNTEVVYHMSEYYTPGAEIGFRWNDPAFNIQWPLMPVIMSAKDQSYAAYEPTLDYSNSTYSF
ncbi:dTDP-4-dehydrorhamnose 3,5-epimerase [Ilyomonas limi]|uniref:dTDP-4-dehydrorhamnose 3,5-epimerase n=1 Tax=Ilyomonas limi TaxID=2575867 RepID=A0A4U3KRT3_9BACT|nr:dTDP-4-dehydrorhamnose 3,5-epimerase [Ilyomonas limi]TKK65010.1 dTDP-4-dehydrorhamnose 3,5-epimerase [Ilyomonas limi]